MSSPSASTADLSRTLEVLQLLSEAHAVAGFEDPVRDLVQGWIEPLVDECRVDRLGNLIALKTSATGSGTVMLDAHMDEIGLMIATVDDEGFLTFAPIGGWDARILPAQGVRIRTRSGTERFGVIGTQPVHITTAAERKKPFQIDDLFIDVGARSREEVENMGIRPGDPAVIGYGFRQLADGTLIGKAFDDRVGCTVAVRALERLREVELDFDLAIVFTTFEEVGTRGARTAAFQLQPDVALALECTVGADVPGVPAHRRPSSTGKGPAITLADRSIIVNRRMVTALESAAESVDVPWQYKKPISGGTDAGGIHITGAGSLAGVVSVPARYIHSPLQVIRIDDLLATEALVERFLRDAGSLIERQ